MTLGKKYLSLVLVGLHRLREACKATEKMRLSSALTVSSILFSENSYESHVSMPNVFP